MKTTGIIAMSLSAAVFTVAVAGGELDDRLEKRGYVDISEADTTLVVDLMYARNDNFVGVAMYDGLTKAYLHPDAAKALKKASRLLAELRPGYRLKVCDAARPMSVQRRMYNKVKGTPQAPYVSNPSNGGGLHNYGLAVDITIVDSDGHELPMGTPVDHLGPEANIDKEESLVSRGVISRDEMQNRRLLRRVMTDAGFKPLRSEWWHFNLVGRPYARKHYKVIEF